MLFLVFFFFKHKTAYEMRISDWSSDVCSSDLLAPLPVALDGLADRLQIKAPMAAEARILGGDRSARHVAVDLRQRQPFAMNLSAVHPCADHRHGRGRVDEAIRHHPQHRAGDEEDRKSVV